MKKKNGEFPNYTLFNSFTNTNVTSFNKLILIIFFIYIFFTFSEEGLINALSEQIISEYNISQEKYSLVKIISSLGQITSSIILLKLIKKIINIYKIICISSLLIKSIIFISYYYPYSFLFFLLTRYISNFIRLFEFVYFISWFAQSMKKPIFGIFGLLMILICTQIGNTFGYYFNYLNRELSNSEKWRTVFLRMGILYLIFSFLLTLISSEEFKLKKNIYYPSSRFDKAKDNQKINDFDINQTNSNQRNNSYSIFNVDTLKQIQNKLEKIENKYNLYNLSLEEKLKKTSVSEFDYYSELKSMVLHKIYLFSLISLSIIFLIYYTILFWSNNFIINHLSIKESKKIFINYICISLFGPSLGIALNRAVQLTLTNHKKGSNLLSMFVASFSLCIASILIQTKPLFEYIIFFIIIYICYIFYLLPGVIVLHLKYTQFIFKKEDFIIIIIAKNILGEIVGSLIYIYFLKNDDTMNGMGMIINFSWILLGILGFTLLLEFNTAEIKIQKIENDNEIKLKNYRTTITSEIQGEELKDIDKRESIISVDESDDENIISLNKENEYSLDNYLKK